MLVAILVTVAALSAAVFLILLVALIRHVRGITRAVEEIQAELVPVLQSIQADAERTRARLDRLAGVRDRPPG
jgi:uncharacterized protein YoxC